MAVAAGATALLGSLGQALPAVAQAGSARSTIVGPNALGVNTAAWDSLLLGDAGAIDGALRNIQAGLLRYPGGTTGDQYDWSSNTDTATCGTVAAPACVAIDPVDFTSFSAIARAVDAQSFVTINYGTGTPAEAAGWVAEAKATPRQHVALWEIGNESYACYEPNDHLPTSDGYVNGHPVAGSVCPSTPTLAASYVANSGAYGAAMQAVDPSIRIGVPWAFTRAEASGSAVTDASAWNDTVLRADSRFVGFVDAHWYPFSGVDGLSDLQIVQSVRRIPTAAAVIRSTLHRLVPRAGWVVGETDISNNSTTLDFQPVSALYAAATTLEWLVQGAQSVSWWDLNNYGSPFGGDFGLLSSGAPEPAPEGTPLPPYYGEELAAPLTTSGSRLTALRTNNSSIYGFQSDLAGHRRLLYVNAGSDPVPLAFGASFRPGSTVAVSTYSQASASSADPVVSWVEPIGDPVSLPPESIVVLSGVAN